MLEIISAEEYDAFLGLREPTEELAIGSEYNLMLRFHDRAYKAGRTAARIAQLIPNPSVNAQLIMLHLGDEAAQLNGVHRKGLLIPDDSTNATRHQGKAPNYIVGGYLLSRHTETLELVSVGAENTLPALTDAR